MEKKEEGRFDVACVAARLKAINSKLDHISISEFIALCLSFTKLSGSMGKLVSWGFQDIFSKCNILSDHAKTHTDCATLQEIIAKEMSLNIHVLSGGNNSKFARGKEPLYAHYESASRTILRLLWFLSLITHLLKGLKETPGDSLSSVGRKAYNNSIAPFHPFMLRNAIRLIFYTVPSRKHFIEKTFGGIDEATFSGLASEVLIPLEPLVEYLWKYYKDRSLTQLE